ncbi:MAG: hypothetical protein LBP91_03360 [Coriobacteriales bacterium]|nr:hypothetical protein [Coriobacteriales bacterium]
MADLQDKSIPNRIRAMVSIAHPDFRESLLDNAKAAGLLSD